MNVVVGTEYRTTSWRCRWRKQTNVNNSVGAAVLFWGPNT